MQPVLSEYSEKALPSLIKDVALSFIHITDSNKKKHLFIPILSVI